MGGLPLNAFLVDTGVPQGIKIGLDDISFIFTCPYQKSSPWSASTEIVVSRILYCQFEIKLFFKINFGFTSPEGRASTPTGGELP